MELHRPSIFKSIVPVDTSHLCHFDAPENIQSCLEDVCKAWGSYLQDFANLTTELFGTAELPWNGTERAMVSSLAAAIIREFPNSVVVEEGRVPRINHWGRCDLWASIPDRSHTGKRFNFYLEAKAGSCVSVGELPDFLKGPHGVSRLYRVHQKSQVLRTSKLSPFIKYKDRMHEHYVIGLLVTRLKAGKDDSPSIDHALRDVFENRQTILLRKRSDGKVPTRKRNLGRSPTVAMVVLPGGSQSGMIASFTVFASTSGLLAQKE